MRTWIATVGIAAALFFVPAVGHVTAQDAKDDAKKAGKQTKEAGKDAGEAAKSAGKSAGEAGKAAGEGAKEAGKAAGEAGKDVGKATKDAAKGVKNDVQGKTITARCADGTLQKGVSAATACTDHGGVRKK